MALFKTGLTHVYYGDGKGKTTAAAGLAARVTGAGGRVLFAQFLKNGRSSELKALAALGVEILAEPCVKFLRDMGEAEGIEAVAAQRGAFLRAAELLKTGVYDLLVLDEALDMADLGIIGREELLALIREKPASLELAITGHAAFPELIGAADYATEIHKVKHPYDKGVKARRGAEF